MTAFQDYDRPLETVFSFKYLGCLLTATNDNLPDFTSNFQKASNIWSRVAWILRWEGAGTRKLVRFYVAVVQDILLFGSETWMVNPRIKCLLGGFHHRVERRISGKMPQRQEEEVC